MRFNTAREFARSQLQEHGFDAFIVRYALFAISFISIRLQGVTLFQEASLQGFIENLARNPLLLVVGWMGPPR